VDNTGGLTLRQQMVQLLAEGRYRAREISQELGIREKEVYDHLPHIARSLEHRAQKLMVEPASCLSCGYLFRKRGRFEKPGKCPLCKAQHIREPRYYIAGR
jgi:predicted Zn-ribbon and HTH transcriptional regulator